LGQRVTRLQKLSDAVCVVVYDIGHAQWLVIWSWPTAIGSVLGDYSTVTGLDIESMGKLIGFSWKQTEIWQWLHLFQL